VTEDSSRLSEVFDALSDNNRCQLFRVFVKHNNLNVTEVALALNMSLPLASQHLKILENAQMLKRNKIGRQVFYQMNDQDPIVASLVRAILS
jgi:DNA-binding transcriptional ArsR family regulator